MIFKPSPCRSRWEGLAATSWILLIDLALGIWLISRPVDGVSLLLVLILLASVPALIWLGLRTLGAFNLEYWMDRNAVTVRWGLQRQIIPLGAIRRVVDGGVGDGLVDLSGNHWSRWPSPFVRPARAAGLVGVRMLASRPLDRCVLLDTGETGIFALSPVNNQVFIQALQARAELGTTESEGRVRLERPRLCNNMEPGELFDRPSQALLGLGLLGLLILVGILMIRYPGLPEALTIRYNREGIPDLVRGKSALFVLPIIGAVSFGFNSIWGLWLACRDHHTAAYLLWSGAILVEFVSLLALFSLMG